MCCLKERGSCHRFPIQSTIYYLRKIKVAVNIRATTKVHITSEGSALRGKCFPTFPTAGSTRDRCACADYHVPEFASGANYTVIDLSIKNYSCTEPFFDKYHDEIAHLADLRTTEP